MAPTSSPTHPQARPRHLSAQAPSTDDCTPGRSESLADVIEWLFVVFEQRLGLTKVLETVHECCRELAIDLNPAGLDRLEPIAHRRLSAMAAALGPASQSPGFSWPIITARPITGNGLCR